MDKVFAERVLEISEPYDYASLRRRWKKLCTEYHPDKCAKAGMTESAANEALKDINEAFEFLKPLVVDGGTVTPGEPIADPDLVENAYQEAILVMSHATNASEYEAAASVFEAIGDYRAARALAEECLRRAEMLKAVENVYQEAVFVMSHATNASEYEAAASVFEAIGDYRDAHALAEECLRRAEMLKAAERSGAGANAATEGERAAAASEPSPGRRRFPKAVLVLVAAVLAVGVWEFASLNPSQAEMQGPDDPPPETVPPTGDEAQSDSETNPYYYEYGISFGEQVDEKHGLWFESCDSWEKVFEEGAQALVEMGIDDAHAREIVNQAYSNIQREKNILEGYQAFECDGRVFYIVLYAVSEDDSDVNFHQYMRIFYEPYQTSEDVRKNTGYTPVEERHVKDISQILQQVKED